MEKHVYDEVMKFKRKYPLTIAWRLKKHAKVLEKHLNPGEEIVYAFAGQKNDNPLDIITTYIILVTNKRILLGQDRLVFGYFLTSITPDLFNDLEVSSGIIWGKIYIDTVKELVVISNLDKKSLPEIETSISEYMMHKKRHMKQGETNV